MEVKMPILDWKPFDKKNPPSDLVVGHKYLILLREKYNTDKFWRTYRTDIAIPYCSYLDNFWNTESYAIPENKIAEVISYTEIPTYISEDELATKGVLYGVSDDGNVDDGFDCYCLSKQTAYEYLAEFGDYADNVFAPGIYELNLCAPNELATSKKQLYYAITFETNGVAACARMGIMASTEAIEYRFNTDYKKYCKRYSGVIPVDRRPSNFNEMHKIINEEIANWKEKNQESED